MPIATDVHGVLQPGGGGPSVGEQVVLGGEALEPFGVHDDHPPGKCAGVEHPRGDHSRCPGKDQQPHALLPEHHERAAGDDDREPEPGRRVHHARAHRERERDPCPPADERREPHRTQRERDHPRLEVVLECVDARLRHPVPDAHREHQRGGAPAGCQQCAAEYPSGAGDGQQHHQERREQHVRYRRAGRGHHGRKGVVDDGEVVLSAEQHAVAGEERGIG